MNISKKVLSFFMCFLMLLSVLSVAAAAKEPVVEVTCAALAEAKAGDYFPKKSDFSVSGPLEIVSVSFVKVITNQTLPVNGVFEKETEYRVNVTVKATEDITEPFKAEINGKTATVTVPPILGGKAVISFIFTLKEISSVVISGIPVISAGTAPVTAADITLSDGVALIENGLHWKVWSDEASGWVPMEQGETFSEGSIYMLKCYVELEKNFSYADTVTATVENTVDSDVYVDDVYNTPEQKVISAIYEITGVVEKIVLTVDGYAFGNSFENMTVTENTDGMHFYYDTGAFSEDFFINDADNYPSSGNFGYDKKYIVEIDLYLDNAYELSDDFSSDGLKINIPYESFELIPSSGNCITLRLTLPELKADVREKVSSIAVTVNPPVELAAIDCNVNTVAAPGYALNNLEYINWYEADENYSSLSDWTQLTAGEKFKAGKYYYIQINAISNDGVKFTSDTAVTVNGNAAEVKYLTEDELTFGYVFLPVITHTCETYVIAKIEASCNTLGKEAYYRCSICGSNYEDDVATKPISDIDAWGRIDYKEHTGGTATCKDKAVCKICGMSYGEKDADNHVNVTVLKAEEATCTISGRTEGKKCDDCKKEITKQTETPFADHKEEIIKGKKATYKKDGLTDGIRCSVCGASIVQQKVIDKKKLGKVKGLKVKSVKLASGTKTTLTLAWNKVDGAEKYEVYQHNGKKWTKVGTTSKTTLTVKKLKANKSYKFRVRAVLSGEKAGAYGTLTAKTVPLKTTLTLKAGKKQLTASWKTVANITGYEVQYSTSKKFTKKTTKTLTIKKAKTKKTTIKKLKKGKKYFVRVRAYKTVGKVKIYGAYSSAKNVKIK